MDKAVPGYLVDTIKILSPLPPAVRKLLALSNDIDLEPERVASIIGSDQLLVVRVIRAANSSLFDIFGTVQTASQSISVLGRRPVINLSSAFSILDWQSQRLTRWPADPWNVWRHSVATGLMARSLARHVCACNPDQAFLAGVMHDIGKIVLLEHFGDLYVQVLLAAQYGTGPLYVLERDVLHTDHASVGRALCLAWGLPPEIIQAVGDHHDTADPTPGSLAEITRDANELVKMLGLSESGNHFVALSTSPSVPHRQLLAASLKELISWLPRDIIEIESILYNGEKSLKRIGASDLVRKHVQVQVGVPEERDLLYCTLLGMGYDVVSNSDTDEYTFIVSNGNPPSGLITDLPIPSECVLQRVTNEIPVLDYTEWRSRREHLIPAGHFDVNLLRHWIEAGLTQSARSSLRRVEDSPWAENNLGPNPENRHWPENGLGHSSENSHWSDNGLGHSSENSHWSDNRLGHSSENSPESNIEDDQDNDREDDVLRNSSRPRNTVVAPHTNLRLYRPTPGDYQHP